MADSTCDRWLTALQAFNAANTYAEYNFFRFDMLPLLAREEEELAESLSVDEMPSADGWRAVRDLVKLELAAKMLAFGLRMAIVAVRRHRPLYLEAGVKGLILDDDLLDDRDVSRVLCVFFDAGIRIGADIHSIMTSAAGYAAPFRRSVIASYIKGPEYQKSLESMGFDAVESKSGFLYRLIPF